MHSFHQSRGRIAFEVFCSLTVSASCAAAWLQTGATAFLPAAAATGLFGLWHLTDLRSPKARLAVGAEVQGELPEQVEAVGLASVVAEPSIKPKKRSRKKAGVEELPVKPVAAIDPEAAPVFPDRAEIEDELHAPIAPLFETKPFALQQRPSFGRKAG